jgi:hypothetical protein
MEKEVNIEIVSAEVKALQIAVDLALRVKNHLDTKLTAEEAKNQADLIADLKNRLLK